MRIAIFLRGINIGSNSLSMAQLGQIAEQAGFRNPKTFLNSGNLLVDTQETADRVKSAMEEALVTHTGKTIYCLVRTQAQLEMLAAQPITVSQTHHHYVLLCDAPLFDALQQEYAQYPHGEGELFKRASGDDIHWVTPKGQTLEAFGGRILGDKRYKQHLTSRNINTLRRMLAALD